MASLTSFLGSNPNLLLFLTKHQRDLSDLEDLFRTRITQEDRRHKMEIISFYETKPTWVLGLINIDIVSSDAPYV